jgi:hypothetical protein
MESERLHSASPSVVFSPGNKGSILSPSTYLFKSLEPFLNSEKVTILSDISLQDSSGFDPDSLNGTKLLLSIEDKKDLSTESMLKYTGKFDSVCGYFHDTAFLENPAILSSEAPSYMKSVLFPWENNHSELRKFIESKCRYFYFPYPWVHVDACRNDSIGDPGLHESPVVLTMRGVREGRLHVILEALDDLDLLDQTIILTEKKRKPEFQRALWSLKIDSVKCYEPRNLLSIKSLLANALCLINPSFSSVRPLSPLLMEAFHEKVPVLLSDFGSSRLLPDCIQKFELGSKEREDLKMYLKKRMDAYSVRRDESIQQSLFSYAEEYGNPESLANELLGILDI